MVYTIISSYSKLPTGWMACLPFTAAQVNWWPPHQMENSRFECYIFIWLVVDLLLWKIWKSVGIIVPNIWKNKKCSEPPTSCIWHCFTLFSLFLSLSYYSHFDDMIISFFFLTQCSIPIFCRFTASGFSAFTAMISPVVLRRAAKTQPTA